MYKRQVLAKHLLNTVDRAFVVGDEPLFIGLTELILLADPDALKDLLHLFFGGGQLYPLTNQHTLVVLAKVCDEGLSLIHIYLVPVLLYSKRMNKPVIIATSTIALQEQLWRCLLYTSRCV